MEITGRYFDDLPIGEEFRGPSRTVTETDVVMFAALTGDYDQVHTSEEFAKETQFGTRIAHGLLGLSMAHGLMWARTGMVIGTGIAFLGIREWQFLRPILIGDTINVRYRVHDRHASRSKPDRGVICFAVEVINQRGETVQKGLKDLMMKRRPEAGSDSTREG